MDELGREVKPHMWLQPSVGVAGIFPDPELAPRAVCGAQQLLRTTACAHLCVLGSTGFAQLHAQLGASSWRKFLTYSPSPWTFPLHRPPFRQQEELSIIS